MSDRSPRRSVAALLAAAALAVAGAPRADACDVCAVYTATELLATRTGVRVGVAEQFSRFGTGIPDALGEPQDRREWLNGSTTQVLVGYDPKPLFGFQLNLPIIARAYRRLENDVLVGNRIEDDVLVHGTETGIGDMSLLGILRPFSYVNEESVVRFTLLGGLKFPTGDPSRLKEEQELRDQALAGEGLVEGVHVGRESHHIPEGSPSGINGHDLALGSGSWDGIVGALGYASYERFFVTTAAQYAIRTEGAYGYQYGNEVNWFATLGGYAVLNDAYTLALQVVASGVHQEQDTLDGTPTSAEGDDDGATRDWVFLGPGLSATWGTTLSAEIAGDIPVLRNDVGLIPEFRIRAGMVWRF